MNRETMAGVGTRGAFGIPRSRSTRRGVDRPWSDGVPRASNWLADEVAIDFPAFGAVVDQIRDGFVTPDEAPRQLSREIHVSPLDAFTGTVVALDLPLQGICRECGGRGETWEEPCLACTGSGEAPFRHPIQVVVPPRSADGTRIRLHVSTPHASATRVEVRVCVVSRVPRRM